MRPFGPAYWGIVLAAIAVYAAMVIWSLPGIAAGAGGLPPFDMRPAGYSFAEAQAFLAALGPEAKARYLSVQHPLDALFPALMAAALALPLWWLSTGWPRTLRGLLAAIPILAALADWSENGLVRAMLLSGPDDLSADLAARAAAATVTKSVLVALSVIAVVALGVRRFRRGKGAA